MQRTLIMPSKKRIYYYYIVQDGFIPGTLTHTFSIRKKTLINFKFWFLELLNIPTDEQ